MAMMLGVIHMVHRRIKMRRRATNGMVFQMKMAKRTIQQRGPAEMAINDIIGKDRVITVDPAQNHREFIKVASKCCHLHEALKKNSHLY